MLLHTRYLVFLLLAVMGASSLTACDSGGPPGSAPGPTEVGVVTLVAVDTPVSVELPGRTQAYRKAEVRPQVSGIIDKRLFEEGSLVEEGSQLYQINLASYQAAYNTARAELASAEADFTAAQAREVRYRNLVSAKAVSQQNYDDALATLGQAKASLMAGKASVERAEINLEYTRVVAPIAGVIGKSSVTEGALVTAGQTQVLATIQQLDPIYVEVSQSANELLNMRRQIMQGKVVSTDSANVQIIFDDGSIYEHPGKLQFSEVGVNESTGTVVLRAIFPNPDQLLLPGMFVRTRVEEGVHLDALLVPQQGIARDRSGNATALVVNTEGNVELRKINAARAIGDKWLVEEGLSAGDKVIVEGLQKVKPGALVKPVSSATE